MPAGLVIVKQGDNANRYDHKQDDQAEHGDDHAANVIPYEAIAFGSIKLQFVADLVAEIREKSWQQSFGGGRCAGYGWKSQVGDDCALHGVILPWSERA